MTQTRQNKLLPFISLLSLAGAAISAWQTHLYYLTRSGMGDLHSFCNIGQTFDCTAIEMSRYSEFAGNFPLSGFAIAGYLLIFVLSLYGFSESMKKNIKPFLITFSAIAVLFSAAYFVIMIALIGKLCILCLTVDALNLILLISAILLPKQESYASNSGINVTQFLGAGVASLLVAFLITKGLDPQADQKSADVNDIVESVLASPVTPIVLPADVPIIGNPNAPITVIKFSDYQCPACKLGATASHPLFKRYPREVKFAFVNFPLATECNPDPELKHTMHPFACEAAAVAVCATEQGKFPEAYEALFEYQTEFKEGQIANLAASKVPGLDLEKMKSCMTLPSTAEKIKRDAQLGIQSKIVSTPTFFVNGKKIEGGLPTNVWIQILDHMLSNR